MEATVLPSATTDQSPAWASMVTLIGVAIAVAAVVAGITLAASREQLAGGGPGVMVVTVPVPAAILLFVSLVCAAQARSFRVGVRTGFIAVVSSFAAVFAVVALEGLVWMDKRGVFALDADPPSQPVGAMDVVLDFFTTGLWIGHLALWLPCVVIGAALGARVGARIGPPRAQN
jgi:hypothetical protein